MMTARYKPIIPVIFCQRQGLLQLLGLAVVAAVLTALLPWPLKLLVDYALVDENASTGNNLFNFSPLTLVILAAVASLLIFSANSAINVASSWLWSKVGQLMVIDLSTRLFDRLQHLSRLYHTKHPIADSLSRLTVDTWCVFTIAQALLITPIQNLLTLAVVSLFAWQLDPFLTVLSLALAPVLAITSIIFGNGIRNNSRKVRESQSRLMTFVHQTLGVIPLVQVFGRERRNSRDYQVLSDSVVSTVKKNALVDHGFNLINGVAMSIGLAIVLYAGSQQVIAGTITVGSLLVFLGYLQTLQGEAESLLMTYRNLKTAEASLDRVLHIVETSDEVSDGEHSRLLPRTTRARAIDIEFRNISFGYEADSPVLKNISLHIPAGQTVAFVGGSGSGKSTLASLVPRFFEANSGEILIDKKPIQEIAISSLRDRISLVLQDPYLLPISIADNIAYGKPGATRDEIVKAATAANASAFIRKLPGGYKTVLGERGVTLSGGQRQRLSIARALLKDAPILILDEPTSALDNRTESLFMDALKRLMHGRTTIIVAHRLQTIIDADKIVVLHNGEITEKGTHAELLANDGFYAEMYRIQHPENHDNADITGKAA